MTIVKREINIEINEIQIKSDRLSFMRRSSSRDLMTKKTFLAGILVEND